MFLIVIHVYIAVIGIQAFSEINAQAKYLCDFISRNNFVNSWDHVLSHCEYTLC